MTALKLEGFTGLIPRVSSRLLPNMAATVARNTKLLNGELRAFRSPREVADFSSAGYAVERAYRIEYDEYGTMEETWLTFDSRDVDVIRSPIINDLYNRYYWAGDGRPMYNTLNRIIAGDDPLLLGVPTPVTAPTVTPAVGSSTTRSYVYTFVSAYGEEGPPSPPRLATGGAGTWVLSGMDTTVPDASDRNINVKRIYRTVPGQTGTQFFFVGQVSLGTAGFNDTVSDTDAALGNILESTAWTEPPSDLEGFVAMPNGYLVGWVGRRLVFSEPYRPHAWPAQYELATEFEIMGLGVWGSTLVVGTKSQPYMGQGVSPASFTMVKMDAVEQCLSRRGMVATLAGVYYPSLNGLVFVNSSGVRVVTQELVTREEWAAYNPQNIYATQLGLQYIAFNSETFGFIFNPTEPATRLVELDTFEGVIGIETDRYTGEVYLIQENQARSWDPLETLSLFWRWRSKEFHFPKPLNFGAYIASFDASGIDVSDDISETYGPYNTARFAAGPLSTLGGHALGGGSQDPDQVPGWVLGEFRSPLGGSPLFPVNFLSTQTPSARLIVYADGVEVYDRVINHQRMNRLPSGFKASVWQFELVGNTPFFSLQVAETGKELRTV